MNEDFNDIEFLRGMAHHSFVDKKNEVRVNVGYAATMAPRYHALRDIGHNILIGVQSCGMDQARLDQMCDFLRLNCATLGVDLLVTKSNRPFDSQWYIYGDIAGLLRQAQRELVRPPFSPPLYNDLDRALGMMRRHRHI